MKTLSAIVAALGAAVLTLAVEAGPRCRSSRIFSGGRNFVARDFAPFALAGKKSVQPKAGEDKTKGPAIEILRPESAGVHKKEGSSPNTYFRSQGNVYLFPEKPILYSLIYRADDVGQSWPAMMSQPPEKDKSGWEGKYYEMRPMPNLVSYVCIVESIDPVVRETETFSLSASGSLVARVRKRPTEPRPLTKGKFGISQPPADKEYKIGDTFTASGDLTDDIAHIPLLGVLVNKNYPEQTAIIGEVKETGKKWKIKFEIKGKDVRPSDDYILRIGTLQGYVMPTDRRIKVKG